MDNLTLKESKGQKLLNFKFSKYDEELILVFEKGYVCLNINFGWGHEDAEIIEEDVAFCDFSEEELFEVGIISQEEMNKKREKEKQEEKLRLVKLEQKKEQEERKEYLRLKKKYESNP